VRPSEIAAGMAEIHGQVRCFRLGEARKRRKQFGQLPESLLRTHRTQFGDGLLPSEENEALATSRNAREVLPKVTSHVGG